MFDAMKLLNFTNDRLLVDSLDVAERFGKLRKNSFVTPREARILNRKS
jgi:hypothetical protein